MQVERVVRVPSEQGPGTPQSVVVQLPAGGAAGAVQLEVTRSGCLSAAAPLLVLPNAAAAAELRHLEGALSGGSGFDSECDLPLNVDLVCCRQAVPCPAPGDRAERRALRASRAACHDGLMAE